MMANTMSNTYVTAAARLFEVEALLRRVSFDDYVKRHDLLRERSRLIRSLGTDWSSR